MYGLKTTFWIACALIWGFKGWEITPLVFSGNGRDGIMVGLAFCIVVLSCIGSALGNLEKALRT